MVFTVGRMTATVPFDTRAKRPTIKGAEWHVTVRLVRDGIILEESAQPLRVADSRLNDEFQDSARAIALWINDQAMRRARIESSQRRAAKRR